MDIGVFILGGAIIASALYSWFLSRIQHIYHPDHIWLTVVGGNALIGGFFAWWLQLEGLPLTAFWQLLALNVAAGAPVIAWQLGQNAARRAQRRPGNEGDRATTPTRGASGDRPAPGGSGRP